VLSRRWLNCSGPTTIGLSVAGDRLTARIQPLLDQVQNVTFEELGAGHAELAWLRNASETTVLSATALSKTASLFGARSFACDHCDPLGGK